jgi:hypothetical protein
MRQTHAGGDKLFVDYAGDTVPVIVDRDRHQTLLFPEAVDDYVGAENRCGSSTPLLMGSTLGRQGSAMSCWR